MNSSLTNRKRRTAKKAFRKQSQPWHFITPQDIQALPNIKFFRIDMSAVEASVIGHLTKLVGPVTQLSV